MLKKYDNVIKQQTEAGVVEEVDETDSGTPGSTHFIPHRAVLKEDRATTKLRVVYDASSKRSGYASLNDCLETGPNLAPLIFDILLRFRMKKVALIGDLEKAFLSIGIDPKQRDFLRFLWVDDINSDNPTIKTLKFTSLAVGLTTSPYCLNATIRQHLEGYRETSPDFVEHVINSLYVDDYAASQNSDVESFELYTQLKNVFQARGFNMRKFASNSESLMQLIEKEEGSINQVQNLPTNEKEIENAEKSCLDSKLVAKNSEIVLEDDETFLKSTSNAFCTENEIKVLGIPWNHVKDELKFDLSNFSAAAEQENITKRHILSTTARFFGPLGLLSPVIVPLKGIVQEVYDLI